MWNSFLGDAADILQCWLYAMLLVFFFNMLKAALPELDYLVDLERQYRSFAFYRGIAVTYLKVVFCALMNMINMRFDNSTLALSASMAAIFFAFFLAFPIYHSA